MSAECRRLASKLTEPLCSCFPGACHLNITNRKGTMIHTDGRPTIANHPGVQPTPTEELDVTGLGYGGGVSSEDRFLIDEDELARRIAEARAEGYAAGMGARDES